MEDNNKDIEKMLSDSVKSADLAHYKLVGTILAVSSPHLIIDVLLGCPIPMIYFRFDGVLVLASRLFASILGYSPTELSGKKILDFIHPDDLEPTNDAMAYAAKGLEPAQFVNRYKHKDGEYIWLLWEPQPEAQDSKYGVAFARHIQNPPDNMKAGFVDNDNLDLTELY